MQSFCWSGPLEIKLDCQIVTHKVKWVWHPCFRPRWRNAVFEIYSNEFNYFLITSCLNLVRDTFPAPPQRLKCICCETITYFLFRSTVQDNGRPNNAIVAFVEVAVVGSIKVCEDEHGLEIGVLSVSKLLDVVCHYARGVDVLNGKNHKTMSEWSGAWRTGKGNVTFRRQTINQQITREVS